LFVKSVRFAPHDADCTCRTIRQTGTQAIAPGILDQSGFAFNERKCAFVTGSDAQAATVAFILINLNDLSLHAILLMTACSGRLFSSGIVL
jgi:hypothetical protein